MRWRRRVFVAAALALSACSGGEVATPSPGGVTLAYAGNLDGEIEPCG